MMSRVVRVTLVALAVTGACALPTRAVAQSAMDTVTIRTVKVADGVFMLVGSGGNIGVSVGEDGVVLIDDQFAPLTTRILAAVRALSPNPVKFLINTHFHGDHTGGNDNIGKTGVVIVAQNNVRERLSKEQFSARFKSRTPPAPKAALPVVTFPTETEIHMNGETLEAHHIPKAHTDGDAIVKFVKANVVHGGDVFVRYGFPFIDRESGGTLLGMVSGIEKLLSVTDANTKYIPGHGELATRSDVEGFLALLKTVRDAAQGAIRKQQALPAFLASKPLAVYETRFGANGFVKADDLLTLAYEELGGARK